VPRPLPVHNNWVPLSALGSGKPAQNMYVQGPFGEAREESAGVKQEQVVGGHQLQCGWDQGGSGSLKAIE